MKTKYVFLAILLSFSLGLSAQGTSLWLTYGQSGFTYSPGVEFNYGFEKGWGLQAGVNAIFVNPNEEHIIQTFKGKHFEPFNNVNFNISKHLLADGDHRLGVSIGLKTYIGSNYKFLHYYDEGDYAIYYNTNNTLAYFGADFGLSYSYKKMSFLFKYDTALNKVRLGVGCYFGTKKDEHDI